MTIILSIASILATAVPAGPALQDPPVAPPGAEQTDSANSSVRIAPPNVTFQPERPVQGSAVLVRVQLDSIRSDPVARIQAELAGEPLHFEADSSGIWQALAGVPIDTKGTARFPVVIAYSSGAADTVSAELPIAIGEYRMEKLTVAPRFGSPPDSALSRRMAEESARARAVSERSHGTPRLWDSTFARPREARITSGFGHGREFNGRVQSRHMGVDFAGAVGTPVRAPARGVVALVDRFYLGGNVVYLDHGAGLVTAYLHLSKHEVAEGDTVERGQVIGLVGATGRVTGPHLHWIARYGSLTINPLSLVDLPPMRASRIVE